MLLLTQLFSSRFKPQTQYMHVSGYYHAVTST